MTRLATPDGALPAQVGEFRSRHRNVPRGIVRGLALFTFAYGAVLTLALPLNIKEAIFCSHALQGFGLVGQLWAGTLVLLGSLIMVRWLLVQGLAFLEHERLRRKAPEELNAWPFVSILVPAYNESDTIVRALNSLIHLDYPRYEVIVVDDGSSDDTHQKALPLAGDYGRCTLRVFTKPNGGKWSALNFAYKQASGDLLLCVDADSGLAKDALRIMVPRMGETDVVAVSGQVTIRNRTNTLTRCQALEYLLGNGGMRTALSALGFVTVVPGPIGLYSRAVMNAISALPGNTAAGEHGKGAVYGPLSGETFAEDFQLSLSALALGGKIVYEPRACAYTKCPDRIDALISQRYRWIRGTWQVFMVYMRSLRAVGKTNRPRLDWLMLALYPVDIFIIPLLNFFFWISIVLAAAGGFDLSAIGEWILSVAILNAMTSAVYILEQDDEMSLLTLVPALDVYQSLLVNGAWVIAAIDELRGSRMRW